MDWIKSNRTQLLAQAQQYATGIDNQGLTVGLTAPEISGFGTTVDTYSTALSSVEAAKASYDAFYEAFMTEKASMVKLMRKYNNRMQASSGITNAKRAEIGLPIPSSSSTPVVPQTVTGLLATPYANGTVRLKWNRSGNAETVTFSIEVSEDSVAWDYLTAVTKTNIRLTDFAPGVTKYFRIVATRGTLQAVPSETVVIYSGSGGGELSIAA